MSVAEPFEIDTVALKQLRQSDDPPVVLDVREPWEVAIASIEGSVSVPLGELVRRAGELPRDKRLAVVCHHGGRSAQASMWLRGQGFDRALNVAGGVDAWAALVDPAMARY